MGVSISLLEKYQHELLWHESARVEEIDDGGGGVGGW